MYGSMYERIVYSQYTVLRQLEASFKAMCPTKEIVSLDGMGPIIIVTTDNSYTNNTSCIKHYATLSGDYIQ